MRTLIAITTLLLCAGFGPAHAAGDVPPALSARLEMLAPGMKPDHVTETALPRDVRGAVRVHHRLSLELTAGTCCGETLIDLDAGRNVTEAGAPVHAGRGCRRVLERRA